MLSKLDSALATLAFSSMTGSIGSLGMAFPPRGHVMYPDTHACTTPLAGPSCGYQILPSEYYISSGTAQRKAIAAGLPQALGFCAIPRANESCCLLVESAGEGVTTNCRLGSR